MDNKILDIIPEGTQFNTSVGKPGNKPDGTPVRQPGSKSNIEPASTPVSNPGSQSDSTPVSKPADTLVGKAVAHHLASKVSTDLKHLLTNLAQYISF